MLRTRRPPKAQTNPLIAAVEPFDHRTRRALYAVAHGPLKRNTWNGCALNRAGAFLGAVVQTSDDATDVLGASRDDVFRFISAWDRIRDDTRRSMLLRDALLEVGLFPPEDLLAAQPTSEPVATDHTAMATSTT